MVGPSTSATQSLFANAEALEVRCLADVRARIKVCCALYFAALLA